MSEYCRILQNTQQSQSILYTYKKECDVQIHYEPPSFNDNNLSHEKASSTFWLYSVLSLHMYRTTGPPKTKIENKKSDQAHERQKC